jgi:hypothetical protein
MLDLLYDIADEINIFQNVENIPLQTFKDIEKILNEKLSAIYQKYIHGCTYIFSYLIFLACFLFPLPTQSD